MKFGKRSTALLGIATAVLLVTSGCSGGLLGGGSDNGGNSGDKGPIKLGMVAPTSGSSAPTGAYMKNGAQLAVDEINKAGGVDGRQLELLVEDGACAGETRTRPAVR